MLCLQLWVTVEVDACHCGLLLSLYFANGSYTTSGVSGLVVRVLVSYEAGHGCSSRAPNDCSYVTAKRSQTMWPAWLEVHSLAHLKTLVRSSGLDENVIEKFCDGVAFYF